ncbi:MAG: four helix bundle protein [Acidobacteriota bacterium]
MATMASPSTEERKPIRSFRDLKVWEKAFHLAVDIHRLTGTLSSQVPAGLPRGMREASVSLTTQIAQGQTHSYLKDFLRCLDHSLAALSDLETRVLLARSLKYMEQAICEDLEGRIAEVRRMEWGLVNRLRAREASH